MNGELERVVATVLDLPELVQRLEGKLAELDGQRLMPLAYRPDDVVKVLPISRAHLFKLLDAGEINSFHEGSARIIPRQALLDYIARRLDSERERSPGIQGAA